MVGEFFLEGWTKRLFIVSDISNVMETCNDSNTSSTCWRNTEAALLSLFLCHFLGAITSRHLRAPSSGKKVRVPPICEQWLIREEKKKRTWGENAKSYHCHHRVTEVISRVWVFWRESEQNTVIHSDIVGSCSNKSFLYKETFLKISSLTFCLKQLWSKM